jgi:hypothetical protein
LCAMMADWSIQCGSVDKVTFVPWRERSAMQKIMEKKVFPGCAWPDWEKLVCLLQLSLEFVTHHPLTSPVLSQKQRRTTVQYNSTVFMSLLSPCQDCLVMQSLVLKHSGRGLIVCMLLPTDTSRMSNVTLHYIKHRSKCPRAYREGSTWS